jgi:hypothetical protein
VMAEGHAMAESVNCTVNWVGPAADGTETPPPVIYILLTDQAGSFKDQCSTPRLTQGRKCWRWRYPRSASD